MKSLSQRERLMLAGLFLSKFDRGGIEVSGILQFF